MFFDAFTLKSAKVLLPCVAAGFAIFFLTNQNVLLAAGALTIMGILGLMLRWPEMGTLVVLFAIYSNIGVLAMRPQTAIQACSRGLSPGECLMRMFPTIRQRFAVR